MQPFPATLFKQRSQFIPLCPTCSSFRQENICDRNEDRGFFWSTETKLKCLWLAWMNVGSPQSNRNSAVLTQPGNKRMGPMNTWLEESWNLVDWTLIGFSDTSVLCFNLCLYSKEPRGFNQNIYWKTHRKGVIC